VPTTKMQIVVSRSFRSQFAPVPYPLRSISLKNRWRYDASALDVVSANGQVVGGQKYNLMSYDLQPTPQQLYDSVSGGEPDQYTSQVPKLTDKRIIAKAREVTADAKGNHFEEAVALQKWFRTDGGFEYSTANSRGSGMKALSDFLLQNKSGYCEQFATGMALMARALGIPARVGIGFLPGQAGKNGEHIVRMHDMHAWPELYFQSLGWIRFEPTPSSRAANTPSWTDSSGAISSTPSTTPTSAVSTPGDSESPDISKPQNPHDPLGDQGGGVVSTGNWFTNGGGKVIALTLGVLLLLCIPWLIRVLTRRRRFARAPGRAGVEGLWAEIRDTSRDLGLEWSDTATPRQLGDWLVSELPADAHPAAVRLARGVEADRYAGLADLGLDLRAETRTVRKALWNQAKFIRRWRARLLPPSWRWYLNRGSSEASDLLDEFDLALARLRSVLLPRRGRHAD
jgi:transglutaminase-like putative cysteine protease